MVQVWRLQCNLRLPIIMHTTALKYCALVTLHLNVVYFQIVKQLLTGSRFLFATKLYNYFVHMSSLLRNRELNRITPKEIVSLASERLGQSPIVLDLCLCLLIDHNSDQNSRPL